MSSARWAVGLSGARPLAGLADVGLSWQGFLHVCSGHWRPDQLPGRILEGVLESRGMSGSWGLEQGQCNRPPSPFPGRRTSKSRSSTMLLPSSSSASPGLPTTSAQERSSWPCTTLLTTCWRYVPNPTTTGMAVATSCVPSLPLTPCPSVCQDVQLCWLEEHVQQHLHCLRCCLHCHPPGYPALLVSVGAGEGVGKLRHGMGIPTGCGRPVPAVTEVILLPGSCTAQWFIHWISTLPSSATTSSTS